MGWGGGSEKGSLMSSAKGGWRVKGGGEHFNPVPFVSSGGCGREGSVGGEPTRKF